MSNSLNRTIINRQQRFALNGLSLARVIVLRGEGAIPPQVTGTLENSSRGGARLRLDDCIPYGETATLRIFFDDTVGNQDGELELEVTVCWSRPADDGKWTVGCNCETDLPEDVFAMFADRGKIERRRAARRPTRLVAMARWELSLGERPIEIIEASRTGFSFRAASMGSAGDRLLVRMTTIHGQEAVFAAELRWKANTDSGYLGGCSLINEEDFVCLMPFVNDDKSDNPQGSRGPSKGKRARRPVNLAFAATVFLMFMGPSVLMLPLLQANRAERAIPINTYQPPEATAEIRLAQVDLESPASAEMVTKVVPEPTRSIDAPAPVLPPPALAHGEPPENDEVRQEIPRDDRWTALNVASPPTIVLDNRPSVLAEPDATPTDDHTVDGNSADGNSADDLPIDVVPIVISLVEEITSDETPDEPTAAAPAENVRVEDVPVARAPEEPNLSDLGTEETVRSAAPPDEVRVADAEIVTLEEAIDDHHTVAPTTVAPGAVAPATVATPSVAPVVPEYHVPEYHVPDPLVPNPLVPEPVVPEADIAEPDVAEPVSPEPVVPEAFAAEPAAIEPIVDELVIAAPELTPRVVTPAMRRRAAAEFSRGREALAAGDTSGALAAFAEAVASSPDVALYQYHWALALHLTDQSEAATARIAEAARMEHEHGVANWGQVMQRIQGQPRVWLERARRQALAGS